jgi:hypothetical protein
VNLMLLPRTGIVGLVIATAGVVACSAAPTEGDTSSDGLHVHPGGNEHESHLTLQLPTDACQPGATCAKPLGRAVAVFVDGNAVSLGASTRLKPGSHNVAVNGVGWQVTTNPDQNLAVTLPIAERKCVNAPLPNVPKTDFGGSLTVTNADCPATAQGLATGVPVNTFTSEFYDASCTNTWTSYSGTSVPNCGSAAPYTFSYRNAAGSCIPTGPGISGCTAAASAVIAGLLAPGTALISDSFEAYVPGTLTASVNNVPQAITLNPGDEVDFTLNLPASGNVPPTFATNLAFADSRDNADAARGTITSSCSGDRTYTIPSATGTPATLALAAFTNSACSYTLNVAGRSQPLSQTATNNITLHRLDVDAVTVTREDGSTYTVNGTYTLNFGGVQVAGPFNTGSGTDVLAGTYQFSLNYTDFDGPQTQTQTLTF